MVFPPSPVLKDEPEDLTHLAPTAGDVCVPLDLPALNDMFEDFLNENYCPLLTEDADSPSDSRSSCNSKASGDPFFSYREDSDSGGSPGDPEGRRDLAKVKIGFPRPLVSVSDVSFRFQSPGVCSIPSLCSPERSPILPDDDRMTDFVSLNLDSGSSEMDEDLCLKAPYIPVDEDLPLLIPASSDPMWTASDPDKTNPALKNFADSW